MGQRLRACVVRTRFPVRLSPQVLPPFVFCQVSSYRAAGFGDPGLSPKIEKQDRPVVTGSQKFAAGMKGEVIGLSNSPQTGADRIAALHVLEEDTAVQAARAQDRPVRIERDAGKRLVKAVQG